MEAIVLKAVARELARELPARVQAVLQPSPRGVVLVLRGTAERLLLIATEPEEPRFHLVRTRPTALPAPTAFCRLLRKRLEGRALAAVACPGMERTVVLVFPGGRGGGPELQLVAEIMGKHSNLILVEAATGLVVDALQHVEPPLSRVRTVVPGAPYVPPPASGRIDPWALAAPAFADVWRETGGSPSALFRRLSGFGPATLALAEARARLHPAFAADPGAAVHAELHACRAAVEHGEYRPVFYPDRGTLLPLAVPGWEREPHVEAPTMSDAAERFYADRARRRGAERRRAETERGIRRQIAKIEAEAALREREAGAEAEASLLQAAGTALATGAGDAVPRGATALTVVDPATSEPRDVALDPALGARGNAEALFRRARKIRRRAALAAQKLPALAARRRQLEKELALAADLPPEPPTRRGFETRNGGEAAGAPPVKATPGIREYRSAEGWRILVGKSSAGNDRLTGKIAAPDDLWFHVRDYPGAHVVLKGAGADPPGEVVEAAGSIAAWHSGARGEGMVDVAFTRRRHVRKVKGGPPGKVLLGESATVRVRPGIPPAFQEVGA
jgi:predicted ribosome quality control (RQC) complex YloA/Tae2 family protein